MRFKISKKYITSCIVSSLFKKSSSSFLFSSKQIFDDEDDDLSSKMSDSFTMGSRSFEILSLHATSYRNIFKNINYNSYLMNDLSFL